LLAPIPIRPGFYRRHFVPILKFNLYAYFHEAASALLFQLDKVIISVFSGPAAVSFYNIAGTISQKIQGVSGSLTSIFFPISSALTAAGQHQDLRGVYRRAMRIIIMLAGGMALTVAVFGEQILRYWLGPEFAEKSLAALYVLAATYFLLAIFVTISHFLIGLGGVKRLAGYTALFLVLNISFLLILLPRHGIAGAAWAYFLSLLPLPRFIYEVERSFLGLAETTRFYGTAAAKLAAAGSIYCLLAGFGLRPLVFNLWSVIVAGGASFLAYLGIYKAMGFFDPGDWNIMRRTAKRVFSRNPAAAERE
jgi:O-antigen/teichoic acid export membrane protein